MQWRTTPRETSNNLKRKWFPQRCCENTNTHWRVQTLPTSKQNPREWGDQRGKHILPYRRKEK